MRLRLNVWFRDFHATIKVEPSQRTARNVETEPSNTKGMDTGAVTVSLILRAQTKNLWPANFPTTMAILIRRTLVKKLIWKSDDVWAGRLVCKKTGPSGPSDLWFASWVYKIGWIGNAPSSKTHWTMIAILSDGMVHTPRTQEEIIAWLHEEEMVPMTEEWLKEALHAARSTLGISPTP